MLGQTILHYTILEELGRGGMGIVYKARDTRLDRPVALKFLPPSLATSDTDRARFIQEARAASAINHPNICSIYSIEEWVDPSAAGTAAEHQLCIVMECIDGRTLRETTQSRPVTLTSGIDIGAQIAEGLAAAHEKGIVHRDIKPENIMIRKDGIVQIMDFGLAKLHGNISTLAREGSTLGTAGYMAPEQVQGQEVDHRSDIFSLGVLLYELFTGRLPFKGVHETALIYEIVNVDAPPMSSIQPEIDPELDRIVLGCLEKDPRERTQAARQVAVDLHRLKRASGRQRISRTMPAGAVRPATTLEPSAAHRRMALLPWVITGLITLSAIVAFLLMRSNGVAPEREKRCLAITVITAPGQQILHLDIPSFAISPDGRYLAFALSEGGTSRLFLRPLASFEAHPIQGTENASAPFFSPDGQSIAFFANGKIMRVPVSGGTAEMICDATGFRGAAWGPDDRIIFSPSYASGLMSVAAAGGEVRVFSTLDSTGNERTHRWPQFVAGGTWVLYTAGDRSNPNSYVDAPLVMQSVETGERHVLDVRGEMAWYIDAGYLVVARNGTLLAAPFSLKEFRTTQPLSTVLSDVSGDPGSGVSYCSISSNGHLVYLPGSVNRDLELVSVTHDGIVTPFSLPPQPYNNPRVSPDGTRLSVTIGLVAGNDNDIWIYDLRTGARNRLTFDRKMFSAIWSRDGTKIYHASALPGREGLMVMPADGSSAGTMLLPSTGPLFPISVSPDGTQLLLNTLGGPTEGDMFVLDLNGGKQPRPIFTSPIYEYGGCISPNGRHIVYGSTETGSLEVYPRTYPDLKGKWQISSNGGFNPIWAPDGKAIFYVSAAGKMMEVALDPRAALSPGPPREMFDVSRMYFPNNPIANYDITPDGTRFIMVRNTRFSANVTAFNIVLNWTEDLAHQLSAHR